MGPGKNETDRASHSLTFAMKSSTCMDGGRLVFCLRVRKRSLLPLAMRCSIAVYSHNIHKIKCVANYSSDLKLSRHTIQKQQKSTELLTFFESLLCLWTTQSYLSLSALHLRRGARRRRQQVLLQLLFEVQSSAAAGSQLGKIPHHLQA